MELIMVKDKDSTMAKGMVQIFKYHSLDLWSLIVNHLAWKMLLIEQQWFKFFFEVGYYISIVA